MLAIDSPIENPAVTAPSSALHGADGTPWRQASEAIRRGEPYRRLLERLTAGGGSPAEAPPVDLVRLPVPAAAWVADLVSADLGRPLLVVVPRESDALAWCEAAELFAGRETVVFFPAPSLTPYQEAAASLNVRARESVALDRLLTGNASAVVTTPRALFRRLPPAESFLAGALTLLPDEDHPIDGLAEHLVRWGYSRVDLVTEVGDFAVRGGIVDVFPPGETWPIRIELFGDTVETLRRFDPVSQRTEERIDGVRLLPLLLYPGGPEEARTLGEILSRHGLGDGELLEGLRERGEAPGWENYLPLLAPRTTSLLDLWQSRGDAVGAALEPLIFAIDPDALEAEVELYAERLQGDFEVRRATADRAAVPPEALEHSEEEVSGLLARAELRLRDLIARVEDGIDFAATTTEQFHNQLPRFPQEVETLKARGERAVVVVEAERRQALADLLEGRGLAVGPEGVELVPGDLERGFRLPSAGLALFGEGQLFSPRTAPVRRPPGKRPRFGPFLSNLRDLKAGDFVVHVDHGIGQFLGLRKVGPEGPAGPIPASLAGEAPSAAETVEVMEVAYASGQRLLLPLARLDQIQKFSGIEGVAPRLDKLGGTSWSKTKARVKKGMRDMAGELLKLYAERQLAKAPAMPPDSDMMRQFETAFPYEETADQLESIAAIKEDLERERPMDRLLCGDVGYGKTEVAMRAAFKAVDSGFQVAVLAPTTILADQHLETFRERFSGVPVTVEMISRFKTPAEIRDIQKRLEDGRIDILVGTHRLLSKDIALPRLGLLIVDEEQRFGVAQKERLKQLKKEVHVLAMSATPVPRTLQLSLAGVRDMSVIETPPKDRMAVETAILPFSREVIREAIEYELERGGQVYYVYNRVESIEEVQRFLREVLPRVRVTVGHGQLDEKELSRRMHAFTAGEYDVLLATTIIENGIDIPNVNTMIVHRADRFGLAQLYQLRGRVGRSNQLAYCYLLIPGDQVLSETARKRLAAIREFTDLGAGFRIAARDLEIRGAGNLLGGEQSGHIAAVGIETYLKMLEDTVRELQGEIVEEGPSVTIDLPLPVTIPESYVEDSNLRMEIYRRIASGDEPDGELVDELTDRFGPPPQTVHTLIALGKLKRLAESLRVQAISARGRSLTLRLRRDTRVDIDRLIEFVSNHPAASFSPTGVLTLESGSGPEMLADAQETLEALAA